LNGAEFGFGLLYILGVTDDVSDELETPASPGEAIHPRPATPLAEKAPRRPLGDLASRLLTASVLIPGVLYIIVIGGYPYLVTVLIFGLLAQREFYQLIEGKGARPLTSAGLGFGAAVIAVAWFSSEYHAMLLMTASLLVLMVAQLGKARIEESLASISGTFFGVFYVAWLLSHSVLLRFFFRSAEAHSGGESLSSIGLVPESGIFLTIYCLAAVVLCDAGAYFAGRSWGRRKLAPEISPNKSVEGALGGIFLGTSGGLAVKLFFDFFWPELSAALPWSMALVFALVLCVVGIVGDLVESLLKRDAAVKDTGALLPGMGGVLDRIDAPLLAFPAMYYMMLGYVWIRLH
jgi:phosphatidate cytidylyltransferase